MFEIYRGDLTPKQGKPFNWLFPKLKTSFETLNPATAPAAGQ
jgi:hypothetical protein